MAPFGSVENPAFSQLEKVLLVTLIAAHMTTFIAVFVKYKVGNNLNVLRLGQELEVNSCSGILVHPLSLGERATCFNTDKVSNPREGEKHNVEGHVRGGG